MSDSRDDLVGDAWGQALLDCLADRPDRPPLELEVDDGTVVPAMDPAWFFLDEPAWAPEERRLLSMVTAGPVLDLGAGAGRASLHLQARGLEVTAVESSPGAAEVCRRRGIIDVREQDLNDPPSDQRWKAVLLLCGNLGLGGSWDGNRRLLDRLAEICADGAVLVGDSVDGGERPDVDLRLRYGELVGPWWSQRNVAAPEIVALVDGTGWAVEQHVEVPQGVDHYVTLRRRPRG